MHPVFSKMTHGDTGAKKATHSKNSSSFYSKLLKKGLDREDGMI